jgi:hypothetical protein
MTQVVECLPSKCRSLSSNSSTTKKKKKGKIVNPVKRKHVSEPSYLLYSFYHLLNTNYLYDVLYSYDYIVQCFSLIPVLELVTFITYLIPIISMISYIPMII